MYPSQPESDSNEWSSLQMKRSRSVEKRVFSTTLQSLRKEKKVTQEQLAQKLGVSPQAVSKWENGSYPEGDLLPAIADFFDVSIDYLYGRSDGEKTIEQKVFEAVYDSTCKEFEDTGRADEHYKTSNLIRNLNCAMQSALWVNNKCYEAPARDPIEHPKMASVVCDDVFYSYFGLREDNDISFFLNKTKNYDLYEELLKDTSKIEKLFKLLSDRDNISIIAFLYTLKNGEFASVDVISKSLGIDKAKVKEFMDKIFGEMEYGECCDVSPFQKASVINASCKEENIFGTASACGGLFMAMMMLAREYTDYPMTFRLVINAKQKSWLDRKKMFKK